MAREDHQPVEGPVERTEHTPEEKRAVCGRTIAFVLALGPRTEGNADILPAVEAARHARVPAVFILTSPERAHDATEAVRRVGRRGNVVYQAVEVEPSSMLEFTCKAADFELFDVPYSVLQIAHEISQSILDDYTSVLILDSAMNKITSEHLYELCLDAREHPEAEVVASWIQWLRRPPYLVTRDFLDRLVETDELTSRDESGRRPVPHIATLDHVFGEEKLAVPLPVHEAVEEFFEGCTMSALEAVELAKFSIAHPDEELHSPNQKLSLTEQAQPAPLSAQDRLLVETAKSVVAASAELAGNEAVDLAWADEFGRRNKLDFPLLNDRKHAGKLAYLDSAATTQRVDVALQAQRDFDEHENANVYRGAYDLSAQATFTFNEARITLENFIGAKRRQTVYCSNTSAAVNLVAQAWGEWNIGAGDLIVCELADHHSASMPFMMLAERKGARVEFVPYDSHGRIDQRAYRELIAQKPKLVVLAQIGNVFGIEAPITELAAAAHEVGARVLVDAAQSFPHMKIDVSNLGADWVAISAHKAYGPMGLGALWVSDEAFAEMDPLAGGGGVVSHVGTHSYYLRPKSIQYEPGTPPVSQAVGWAAAIRYLDSLGMDNVARHGAVLTRRLVRGLNAIEGVNVMGDHTRADGETGLVSFTVRSVTPAETARFLGRLGVAVRSGGHCALPLHASLGMIGTGRISVGVHTTLADVEAALTAVALCRRMHEVR